MLSYLVQILHMLSVCMIMQCATIILYNNNKKFFMHNLCLERYEPGACHVSLSVPGILKGSL